MLGTVYFKSSAGILMLERRQLVRQSDNRFPGKNQGIRRTKVESFQQLYTL